MDKVIIDWEIVHLVNTAINNDIDSIQRINVDGEFDDQVNKLSSFVQTMERLARENGRVALS